MVVRLTMIHFKSIRGISGNHFCSFCFSFIIRLYYLLRYQWLLVGHKFIRTVQKATLLRDGNSENHFIFLLLQWSKAMRNSENGM